MRIEIKPWVSFLAIAAAVACGTFFLSKYRQPAVSSNADLVTLLPDGDSTRFFADFALLRGAGKLKLLNTAQEDPEYLQFVRETHFDYSRDIDALAGAANGRELLFLIRGRFDWPALRQYATHHGGSCNGDRCRIPTRQANRWASFWAVQSDVIALLLGPQSASKLQLHRQGSQASMPDAAVWAQLSPSLLQNPAPLPMPLRLFAGLLRGANPVTLALIPPTGTSDAFDIRLNAGYTSPEAAVAVANQLRLDTKLLNLELAREHETPDPANLAGLLTSGEFHADGTQTIGIWPVRKALLRALE